MTTKSEFSADEWTRITRAPFVAGMAISMADPGGPIEIAKESVAMLRAATSPTSREQLITEIALDIQAESQNKQNPLKGYKPAKDAPGTLAEQVLTELTEARDLVAAKATPEETAAFGLWLVDVAQAAADAGKEGGFMGIGAVRVSDREQTMLDRLREVVSAG
ncbi:hypothetical protein [Nocardioides caricicola]|uniref:Uncharacterized protein n=1 Tax=Nocardioides caricicola TaxID=634770 RepID=A0ABW0MZM7_9ACTN